MTFQPPPPPPPPGPPPAGPPPAGPPGAWGPPPGGPSSRPFDPKSVNQLDWAILGAGLLAFIFSLFGFYTASYGGISDSTGAWHVSGGAFIAWFAMVFAVAGAVVLALALFAPQVALPWPSRLLSLGLFALGSLLEILAIFVHPKFYDAGGFSFGHGFSFWISLIVIIAGLVLSLMRFQQTGGELPGALAKMPNLGGQHQGGHADPLQGPPAYGPPQGPPPAYGPTQGPPPAYEAPQGSPPAYGAPQGPPPAYEAPQGSPPGYAPPPVSPQGP